MPRRPGRKALLVAVKIAALVLLLEASALVHFRVRDGQISYWGRDEIVMNRASEMATGLNDTTPDEVRRRLR